jgi:Flp pilus assembly protein TadG
MKRYLHSLSRDRSGVAAVEFAVVSTLLLILLGGITDYGLALLDKSLLANAVAQGVQYAYLKPTSTSDQIKTVVQGSSSLTGVVGTVTGPACYCLTATTTPTLTAAASCTTTTCADGTKPGTYVIISANYTYNAILSGFSGMGNITLTEAATVRVQ